MRITDTLRVYYSRWLVAADSVIENAALELSGSRITFVGTQSAYQTLQASHRPLAEQIDLGESVVIPGLVNCHVHTNFPFDVELLFDSGSMVSWVQAALAARESRSESQQREDVISALARMQATGTVAIGEIANDFLSLEPIVASGMMCRFFAERLGFPRLLAKDIIDQLEQDIREVNSALDENCCVSIHSAPHAPYSCSAELIQRLTDSSSLSTIHLAENKEEVALLADGSGPWRERLREIGKNDPDWIAPAMSPVQYLESLGVLRQGLLLVHVVQVDDSDIELIAESGATVILCPSSNEFINVGTAPVMKFLERNIPLGLGTDSLASNTDLNLFAEMRLLREQFPDISRRELFAMATSGGAEALGFVENLGKLKVDSSPGVFAVDLSGSGASLDFKSDEELFDTLITVGSDSLRKLADAAIH